MCLSPLAGCVLLVLLQDADPLLQAVVGHRGPTVSPGAVIETHPAALPLQRGEAGIRGGGHILHREAEDRRSGGGDKHEQESVHLWVSGNYGVPLGSDSGSIVVVDDRLHRSYYTSMGCTCWLLLE